MATKSIETLQQQLENAKERVKQLKAKQQAVRARERAKEAKQKRADDTRKKILLGAYVLAKYEPAKIQQVMDDYLVEERDRALFGLKPKAENQASSVEA